MKGKTENNNLAAMKCNYFIALSYLYENPLNIFAISSSLEIFDILIDDTKKYVKKFIAN